MVRVQWLLEGLSRLGLGFRGPFGVDVVAGQIQLLVGGGASLVVGEVVGLSAWWVLLPSHALVLFVHGELWPLWGTVLGSGSAGGGGSVRSGSGGGGVGGVVGGAGCGGGGGGVGGGGDVVGMPLGSPGVPMGRGGRASFAALGAAQLGGWRGWFWGWA